MSIAEMITQGTQQQSQNWSVLSQNLSRLGQQVGQQLALREYQKQAAEALPVLQQQMQAALQDAGSGRAADAYSKLVPLISNPSYTQNPYLLPALEAGMKMTDLSAQDSYKRSLMSMQYGGRVVDGRGASLLDMYSGNVPQEVDGGELPLGGGFDAGVGGEGVGDMMAEDRGTGFGMGTTGNFAFQMEGYQRPSKEIETTANKEFDQYSSGDAASQEAYRTSVMSPQVPKGTEFVEQPGLNRFKGFEQVTGIFVPKEKTVDFPNYSVRKDGKGAISETLTFNKKSINEEQRKKSTELAYNDLPTAIGRISANQALEKYFLENNVEDLDIGSEKDDLGEVSYYIGVRGDKESRMPIEQDDYISATVIRKLPSTSKTFGAPLAITQVKEQVAPAAAAQPAGGAKKLSLEEIARGGAAPAAQPTAAPAAAPAKEMTLEERISAKTAAPPPTRKATPEQLAGVKAGQVRQQKSNLESEATKLERALYDMPRTAGGKKQLKRGLSTQDPDVKAALQRIAEINKQLEAL